MDISNPQIRLGPFQHHLEIYTSETGREACRGHGTKALEGIHDVDVILVGTAHCRRRRLTQANMTTSGRVLYLDDTNTDCKEEEREPLDTSELFPKKHD